MYVVVTGREKTSSQRDDDKWIPNRYANRLADKTLQWKTTLQDFHSEWMDSSSGRIWGHRAIHLYRKPNRHDSESGHEEQLAAYQPKLTTLPTTAAAAAGGCLMMIIDNLLPWLYWWLATTSQQQCSGGSGTSSAFPESGQTAFSAHITNPIFLRGFFLASRLSKLVVSRDVSQAVGHSLAHRTLTLQQLWCWLVGTEEEPKVRQAVRNDRMTCEECWGSFTFRFQVPASVHWLGPGFT